MGCLAEANTSWSLFLAHWDNTGALADCSDAVLGKLVEVYLNWGTGNGLVTERP